jgi:aspartyl-tRNA(Asn)/glutamyl-tRNA(Gln) amidotransferase subunit C
MAETRFDIRYAAQLARIELTPQEVETFEGQLGQILGYIETLQSIDVSGVEPTAHPFPVTNVMRQDVPRESFPADTALRNAPRTASDLFIVPKVIG